MGRSMFTSGRIGPAIAGLRTSSRRSQSASLWLTYVISNTVKATCAIRLGAHYRHWPVRARLPMPIIMPCRVGRSDSQGYARIDIAAVYTTFLTNFTCPHAHCGRNAKFTPITKITFGPGENAPPRASDATATRCCDPALHCSARGLQTYLDDREETVALLVEQRAQSDMPDALAGEEHRTAKAAGRQQEPDCISALDAPRRAC